MSDGEKIHHLKIRLATVTFQRNVALFFSGALVAWALFLLHLLYKAVERAL